MDMISTSGERAPVGWLSLGCSGTAVADDTVLTAAHCMCNWSTGQWIPASTVGFFLPQAGGFNPPPLPGGTVSPNVASYQVHPDVDCAITPFSLGAAPLIGPPDLAVLTLTTPIPLNIVQDYPRLHLGPTKADWDSNVLDDKTASSAPGSFQVGWGGTVSYNSAAGAGTTRRYGPSTPEPALDPCDKVTLEGPCNDFYQWEDYINPAVGSVHAQGDSGGPLYLTDTATDSLVLAGVSSGWHGLDPLETTGFYQQVWAPTGNIGSIGNHTFLIGALGGDSDGDTVPNDIDNCPAKKNPEQVDADGDNVGDDCDNCAPVICAALGTSLTVTCINPTQNDRDKDGVGDTCDLCPEDQNSSTTQGDDDGDGVGNDCDECGSSNGYSSCSLTANCTAKNAGFCVFDQGPGPLVFGRCSLVDDAEPDGIPDGCDSCGFANPSTLNSNDLAEKRERLSNPSVAILADDCDPVPIVRVPVQKPVVMDLVAYSNLKTSDGIDADEVVNIPQNRWLGKQTENQTGAGPKQAWGYRQCDCFGAGGFPRPLDECVGQFGDCKYGDPMSDPNWKLATITLTNDATFLNANGMSILPGTFDRGVAHSMTLRWRWRDDLKNAKVTGQGTCGAAVESCKAHIALFTTTQGPVASPRDASAALRDVFQIVDAPAIKTYVPMPETILPSKCTIIPCLDWYNPKLYLFDPALQNFSEAFATPVLLTKVGSSVAALVQPAGAHDVTSAVSPGVAALIGDTTRMWLTPSEPAYRVRRTPHRGGVQAVAFPRDLSSTSTVDVVLGTAAGLAGGRRIDDVIETSAVGAGGASPRARADVRAVLSGVEEAVYMVGGRSASGNASQAIWRYTIADRAWRIVAEHAAVVPSSQVLAVAYDQPSGKLYVLDLDDEIHLGGKLRRARLTSYDVRAGTAKQLATWPHAGIYDQLWLSTTDDGSLLLSGAKKQTYSVWRLQPKPAGIKYTGIHVGLGTLLGQPTMGEHDPVIAVGKGPGKIEYRALSAAVFAGPQPCSAL